MYLELKFSVPQHHVHTANMETESCNKITTLKFHNMQAHIASVITVMIATTSMGLSQIEWQF